MPRQQDSSDFIAKMKACKKRFVPYEVIVKTLLILTTFLYYDEKSLKSMGFTHKNSIVLK